MTPLKLHKEIIIVVSYNMTQDGDMWEPTQLWEPTDQR